MNPNEKFLRTFENISRTSTMDTLSPPSNAPFNWEQQESIDSFEDDPNRSASNRGATASSEGSEIQRFRQQSPTLARNRPPAWNHPAYHMSIDVAEHDQADQQAKLDPRRLQMSISAENFYTPRDSQDVLSAPVRQRQKQKRYRASDFANISADYLRMTGAVRQFENLLEPVQLSKNKGNRNFRRSEANLAHNSSQTNNKHTKDEMETFIIEEGGMPRTSLKQKSVEDFAFPVPDHKPKKCPIRPGSAHWKELFHWRRKLCDGALIFAVSGIIIMILENEIQAAGFFRENFGWAISLKTLVTVSTIFLLVLVFLYHKVELELYMVNNGLEDWQLALTARRIGQFCLEVIVCGISPLPVDVFIEYTNQFVAEDGENPTPSPVLETVKVPLNLFLSIPMFLRLYWVIRAILLHSDLISDTSSRTISAMNRIKINESFVLKTFMTIRPGTMLLIFISSFWIIASWIFHVCERYQTVPYQSKFGMGMGSMHPDNFGNSLWLIAITYLSIGYGDIVPSTYCGRTISVLTGIVGVGTTSLVVALVARKIQLSRAELHVHNFMRDSVLAKQLRHAAANVLRETWLIYKNRKLSENFDSNKIRHHQKNFLAAIHKMRKVKGKQRTVVEDSITASDLSKTVTTIYETVDNMNYSHQELSAKISKLDDQIRNVAVQLSFMQQLLLRQQQNRTNSATSTPTAISIGAVQTAPVLSGAGAGATGGKPPMVQKRSDTGSAGSAIEPLTTVRGPRPVLSKQMTLPS